MAMIVNVHLFDYLGISKRGYDRRFARTSIDSVCDRHFRWVPFLPFPELIESADRHRIGGPPNACRRTQPAKPIAIATVTDNCRKDAS